jgi:RimJ/RimL family protein N-acetyltransferase
MPPVLPGPAYRIVTPRLIIRCYQPDDAPMLKASIDENIEHLRPWMPWIAAEPQDMQQKIQLLRQFRGCFDLGQDFTFAIFDPAETRLIGSCGLHTRLGEGVREIGYWIHKDFTRQGLATEASAALTRVAFEIDHVSRVEIHCDARNTASASVPNKLGYILQDTRQEPNPIEDDVLRDTMIWVLTVDQYPTSFSVSAPLEAYDAASRLILR